MDNYLIFGDVNSADYGVWISSGGIFNKPSRRVEKISVPGRNGDLTIDEGRFDNVKVTYNAFIARGFENRFNDFISAMMSQTGYQKLQDTYDGSHFRMGLFAEKIEPGVGAFNRSGKFTLTFDCMPQRFLVSGDEWVDIGLGSPSWGIILNNPTNFVSLPVIKTSGRGYFTVACDNAPVTEHAVWNVTVSNPSSGTLPSYIDIDSDMEECYYIANQGAWNEQYEYWNKVVTIQAASGNPRTFPALYPGKTTMSVQTYSPVFSDLKIKPRWWEL